MNNRAEVREFLVSRRARLTPHQAGLPAGGDRRVPGLRRTEVAVLAGVSVEYYTRLERGNLAGASDSVLDAIADALQLDEAERSHLLDLARTADGGAPVRRRRRTSRSRTLRPGLQAALDAITAPAFVRNGRMDVLGTNLLGRAFYDDLFAMDDPVPNLARFVFLSPAARTFYADCPKLRTSTSPCCAPRRAPTPTTTRCTIWWASFPPRARSSALAGARTTCAGTALA